MLPLALFWRILLATFLCCTKFSEKKVNSTSVYSVEFNKTDIDGIVI